MKRNKDTSVKNSDASTTIVRVGTISISVETQEEIKAHLTFILDAARRVTPANLSHHIQGIIASTEKIQEFIENTTHV